jgi:hypothetical protein
VAFFDADQKDSEQQRLSYAKTEKQGLGEASAMFTFKQNEQDN